MAANTSEMAELAKDLIENKPEHEKIRHSEKDDGLRFSPYELNRWQKHGHDRLYFRNADGYINVETGAVEDGAPVTNVEVETVDGDTWVRYYMDETDIDYDGETLVAAIRR